MQVGGPVDAVQLRRCRCSRRGACESTSDGGLGGVLRPRGPPGITWCVWTSKMNSVPVSACWQAAVSSGGGTANLPPRPAWRSGRPVRRRRDEQPANSKAAREAATAPAPWRKRRRSTPSRRADSSMERRTSSLTARSRGPPAAGTNSPLEIGPAGSGRRSSCRSRCRREKGPMPAMPRTIRLGRRRRWSGAGAEPALRPGGRVRCGGTASACCHRRRQRGARDRRGRRSTRRGHRRQPAGSICTLST